METICAQRREVVAANVLVHGITPVARRRDADESGHHPVKGSDDTNVEFVQYVMDLSAGVGRVLAKFTRVHFVAQAANLFAVPAVRELDDHSVRGECVPHDATVGPPGRAR